MLKLGDHHRFSVSDKGPLPRIQSAHRIGRKFALLSKIEGYTGVEIVYPYEVSDAAATRALLDRYGLDVAAVNVNVKAEPEFRNGGLTSLDSAIRAKAVQFIKMPRILHLPWARTRSPAVPWETVMSFLSSTITRRPGHLVEDLWRGRQLHRRRYPFSSNTNPARPGGTALSIRPPRPSACSMTIQTTIWASPWISATPCTAMRIRPKPWRCWPTAPTNTTSTSMITTGSGTGIISAAPSTSWSMSSSSTT
jgi:hypothetical protein